MGRRPTADPAPRVRREDAQSKLEAAEEHFRWNGQEEQGLEAAQEAVRMCEVEENAAGKARALRLVVLGLSRVNNGEKHTQAVQLAERVRKAHTNRGEPHGEAIIMTALAAIKNQWGTRTEREEALEMAKEAADTLRKFGDKGMEAEAWMVCGELLIKMCDSRAGPKCAKKALRSIREGLEVAEALADRFVEAKMLYMMFIAKVYCEDKRFKDDAVKDGLKAALLFKELGNTRWEGIVQHALGEWHHKKGFFTDALFYAEKAANLFKELNLDVWEARARLVLVSAHKDSDNLGVARSMAQGMVARATMQTKDIKAEAMAALAGVHLTNGEYDDALENAIGAADLYCECGFPKQEGGMQHLAGQIHTWKEDFDAALKAFQEGYDLFAQSGDEYGQAICASCLSRTNLRKHNWDEALKACSKSSAHYQALQDLEGEAVQLLQAAAAHAGKDSMEAAIRSVLDARAIFQDLEFRAREAEATHHLTEYCSAAGRHIQALEAAEHARKLYQKLGNKTMEATSMHWIAQLNLALADKLPMPAERRKVKKHFTVALKAAKEMLALARRIPDEPNLIISALLGTVEALGLLGRDEEAMKRSLEVWRLCKSTGNAQGECDSQILLASLHMWADRIDDATSVASEALALAQKIGDPALEERALALLQQLEPLDERGDRPPREKLRRESVDAPASAGAESYAGPSIEELIPRIHTLAIGLLSVEELHQDRPLMDCGLDSLSMVQFRNTLQQQFPGVPMPASLVFDHPCVRSVAENIVDELRSAHEAGRPAA